MALEFRKDTHQYFFNEQQLVSVSKILSFYFGDSYKNVPKEVLERAQIRGQAVHKVLELFFKNIDMIDVLNKIREKIKFKFQPNILQYCNNALNMVVEYFDDIDSSSYIVEEPVAFKMIAGTPDLVYVDLETVTLCDWKTYKTMSKELRLKAELQLTAYWWLLTNNGYKVKNNTYIYWIKQLQWQVIEVTIDNKKINEWECAIDYWLQHHCYQCHVNEKDVIDGLMTSSLNQKLKICADCQQ